MILSDNSISKMLPSIKAYKRFDEGGLYIEVSPKGGKHWRLKYFFEKKEKRISLGRYPEVNSAEARDRRDKALELLDSGKDPSKVRKSEKLEGYKVVYKNVTNIKKILDDMTVREKKDFLNRYNMIKKNEKEQLVKALIEGKMLTLLAEERAGNDKLENKKAHFLGYEDCSWRDEAIQTLLTEKIYQCKNYAAISEYMDFFVDIFFDSYKNQAVFSSIRKELLWEEEKQKSFIRCAFFAFRDYSLIKDKIDLTQSKCLEVTEALRHILEVISFMKENELGLPCEMVSLRSLLLKLEYNGLAFFSRLNEKNTLVEDMLSALQQSFSSYEYKTGLTDCGVDLQSIKKGHLEAKTKFASSFKKTLQSASPDLGIKKGMRKPGLIFKAMAFVANILFNKKPLVNKKTPADGAFTAKFFEEIFS